MGTADRAQRLATTGDITANALFRAVAETSDDAVFVCDAVGSITTWCKAAERLFGCAASVALGEPLDHLFAEHLRKEVRAVLAMAIAGDQIKRFESEVLLPDGMPMPVSLSLGPVVDDSRGHVASVVIVRDVTEQQLAQASLAEVEARLEQGEALAHVGSWLWDLRTGTVQWSAELYRMHGVDPRGFDGTLESHLQLIHSEDRERVRAAMSASVSSGDPFEAEYRVIRPDHQVQVVRLQAEPTIGSAGTPVGLRGIGQAVEG
ncbi:MAG: PAS domain-containing protein [Acidimicrobiales bacterium]